MFAVLHLADFPLHAVLRTEPAANASLDRQHGASASPAALFDGTSKKSLVLTTNPAARAAGVEVGMTAPQAMARCPNLLIRSPDADAEREATAALLAIALTLAPTVENTAPGICTIDLRGTDVARQQLAATAAVRELTVLGLPATAGIARTPLLALYAARGAAATSPPESARQQTLQLNEPSANYADDAGTASQSAIRNPPSAIARVLLVAPAAETSFLAPLPLAAADPSPELAAVLENWGLRALGDLTALPRDDIVRRFGAEGLALWQRAAGGSPRPLHLVVPPHEFAATMEFEHEIETLEPLLFVLRRFLERLALELRATQHVAAELALTLQLEDETTHAHQFRLPEPTADVEILFRALHTHLESLQTAASIRAVELRLTPARPLVRQQGLFETGLRDPHGFAETLARLAALVGSERVGTPQREDTHRPDAVKLVPPPPVIPPPTAPATAAMPSRNTPAAPALGELHPRLGLPLRRFRPPLPARVEFTDSRASYLWTDRIQGEIAAQTPPWPSSGDWWQSDRAWDRREWDIALVAGGLFRLIETSEGYFLEGEYD